MDSLSGLPNDLSNGTISDPPPASPSQYTNVTDGQTDGGMQWQYRTLH